MTNTSSLSDTLVTVFGGSGFIGNYVAQSLLQRGARLRIASRHPEHSHSLKPLANLGQLQFASCDITDEGSVAAALHGATHVVNLVGAFEGDLEKLMGEAPGTMARIAKANGARAFVHMSAIGPDADSTAAYARAKALGEQRVHEAFPEATILRPSIVFGKDDNFLNMFGQLIQFMPVLPVFGPDAKLQLVHVDDVAEAIAVALEQPEAHGGHIYELGGPEQLTMMEINRRIAAAQGRKRRFLAMSDTLSGLFASLPGTPMSKDQWTLLQPGSTVSGEHRTFADLGIEPKPLGLFLDKWMVRYRKQGRFGLDNVRSDNQAT
ncbi:NADH dehydrogenase [Erythrobacter litoralis]|jgi:NADH dehydrogenase|uniref:3-beta hydroxysteroid dehydrogenase n=1 Tax=Erythrobacter litoralis TaxID=39960 RepID=A0A074M8C3_9SPHN|nr:complex I NDUFA9 subunit family protein [Erythrobacter litoralis]AOL22351.1 NADH dehydrogenase [Erythrobacter litoralis]KEO89639.1 3-beta hydroxysteroid dehydrogenase [Erythrobacter litoralis]MEE4339617.1 complex I NDUFA9 subunit family protein [Erythrobacter sp.]